MINAVCVCGAGTMGSGIARLIAGRGFATIVYDVDALKISNSEASIMQQLDQLVSKNKITLHDKNNTLAHIRFTTNINDCIADLVIEAIVENLQVKVALLNQLAEINHSETIFATNTSSLSVKSIAGSVQHPERVAGLHFFNPAPLMKLVELVTTDVTSSSVVTALSDFVNAIGKTVVYCKDAPGFIVNRVARHYYLESLYLAEEHQVPFADIDKLMKSTGFKMGPFELMDLIGNDINYTVSASLYEAMNRPPRLAPSAWQKQKLEANELGIKTGKGFYDYSDPSPDNT
ncbi:MAG: 3-hydroxybutyryl-CoA dehydrogenase [Chitinophagaceae bacterium]|nr:MAG: 3-hydroxybutyryl-CoA dehydrogenase [Chitinophagaceae bacterium]